MAMNRQRLVSALVLLSLICGAGLAFAAGSPAPKTLPRAEDMVIDPVNYYGQVVQGYYNYDCFVSKDLTRPAKFYIPDGSVYNQPTVFVMVPDGYDTYQFLEASGWKDIADFSKLYIVMMEPGAKGWGDEVTEAKYIDALRDDVSYRPSSAPSPPTSTPRHTARKKPPSSPTTASRRPPTGLEWPSSALWE